MLTHVLRGKVVRFPQGRRPEFPADVVVRGKLAPKVPFGGHAGQSKSSTPGQNIVARANLSTGQFEIENPTPLFPPLVASTTVDRVVFRIDGDTVTAKLERATFDDFMGLLHILQYCFPAFLTVETPESPCILYTWGEVSGVPFQSQFDAEELQMRLWVTTQSSQEARVVKAWERAQLLSKHKRLSNGLHYFHVASRLLVTGNNRFEFMAEALLNIAKSLQCIFGETRDSVRQQLAMLGIDANAIERKYIPYLVLRNEFDVGHVSLAQLSREQSQILHTYADQAEGAFRELYKQLLEKIDRGEYALIPDNDEALSADRSAILARLASHLESAK